MAAQQGMKIIGGIAQFIKGSRMNQIRPDMEKSQALQNSKAIADNAANARMVGAAAAEENIKQGVANTALSATNVAGNPAQALSVLSGAVNDSNNAFVNLGVQEGASQESDRRMQMAVNDKLAAEERMMFDFNKAQPYLAEVAAKNALISGGAQNIFGGLGDAAAADMAGIFDGSTNEMVPVLDRNGETIHVPKYMASQYRPIPQ